MRYVNDLTRESAHLSLAEKGALTALLDHYYSTESPLPVEIQTLCRIAGARDAVEEEAVARVAYEFFPVASGGRRNDRADRDIAETREKLANRAKGGRARADNLSAEERSLIAKNAARKRWGLAGEG